MVSPPTSAASEPIYPCASNRTTRKPKRLSGSEKGNRSLLSCGVRRSQRHIRATAIAMNVPRAAAIAFVILGLASLPGVKCSDCRRKNTCKSCIQLGECSWCSKVKLEHRTELLKRGCFHKREIHEFCLPQHTDDPKSTVTVVKDEPLRGSLHGDPVQIRPQIVRLKLRPGEKFTIDIQFRKAEDYPIDLYYLMDFSSSMSKYKKSLSELGYKLTETMKNVTSNFQLGFGSFVDKVTLPYTDTIPSHLSKPCPKCRPPYSFQNHMPLNKKTDNFSDKVRRASMSGNNDTPEGVLDALLQAIVCRKQINWREKARHLLVVSTDAPFHLAGDGKLGGIVEPHDGKCYIDGNGEYTHGLIFDYPSVSQVHHAALENNVNIIFAVLNKVKEEYGSLSKEIHGASIGLLDRGENIAEIIRSHYEKISTTVHLTDNVKGSVYVSYSALCPNHRARADETWFDTNECTGVRSGGTVRFQAHIIALDCSDNNTINQNITVKPVGINESLTIQLETICNCDCASSHYTGREINSTSCSRAGDLICGQCECHRGRIGERCECNGDDLSILTTTETCIGRGASNQICSGQGECVCGVCKCDTRENPNEQITGQYCECDNYSCEKTNGLTCSGHGICNCKKCSCHPGWTGESCACPLDEQLCTKENDYEICSGKGRCLCGNCFCGNGTTHDDNRYTGKYCQICMTCGQQCELYNDCIECLAYETGTYSEFQCGNCSKKFQFINYTDDVKSLHENLTSSHLCVSEDEMGCNFKYIYYYNEYENLIVWAERNKVCPKEINLIGIITGTIGGTVLIGLIFLLIWKLVTTIHDKREYVKFERERRLARWGRGENPLYKTAIQTYKNPTYHSDSE